MHKSTRRGPRAEGVLSGALAKALAGGPRITSALLERHGACSEQVRAFCAEWPDGAEVTVENALRASSLDLDARWLTCLLTDEARRAYRKAVAPAWRAYRKAVASALVAALVASASKWEDK